MTDTDLSQPADSQPPYLIEGARSGRSKCKTCRRTIAKGAVRIGVLIDGPFGTGYLWHHLNCLARTRLGEVERAYELEAWQHAKEKVKGLPRLDTLRGLKAKAEKQRQQRRSIPHLEVAPTGRSRCKHCGEIIAEGSARVVLGREVSFGQQVRTTPVKVHPGCVAAELERDDAAVQRDGIEAAIAANSTGVDPQVIDAAIAAMQLG
jgi:hypothetical protein